MTNRRVLTLLLAALAILSACVAREQLVAKSAAVPAGIDLSGQWQLHVDSQDTVKRISDAEIKAAGGGEKLIPKSGRRSKGSSSKGTLVHVFLETGMSLKVTQTDFGLFISFDRAIVEEYGFGEKRSISVGPILADRVSGWQGNRYVIETLDEDGAKLSETYRLHDNGSQLIRTIIIVYRDARLIDLQQVFDRV